MAKKETNQNMEENLEPEKEEVLEEILEDLEAESAEEKEEKAEEKTEEIPDPEAVKEEPEETKRFGKKKPKTDKKQDAMKEKIDGLEDQVRRQMAEFDNYRKRTDKEKQAMFEIGARSVIEKVLPVVDNFERGLASIPEEEKGSAFADGMDKIYKQLLTELDALGVKPIEAVGTEFNPDFHNAVMQVASEELESGMIAQELQKGYMYRDTVVRHSMVAVVE